MREPHVLNDAGCFRGLRSAVRRVLPTAVLALLPVVIATAAELRHSPLPDASAPFGPIGWGLVVLLGLLAVGAGAMTMGRPSRPQVPRRAANDSQLGTTSGSATVDRPHAGARSASNNPAPRRPTKRTAPSVEDSPPRTQSMAESPCETPTSEAAGADGPTPLADSDDASDRHPFLALNHVDLSIDVLRRHVECETRPMPAVWVMLLDLCRTHGRERRFREVALEFHRRFNVRKPSWDGYPPGRDEPGLEAYPRLVKAITATWGTHECRRLLDRLLFDNRGGSRRGFTVNAYNDLIALRRAAHSVLQTIEADLALEASQPAPSAPVVTPGAPSANDATASASPLIRELEDQLEDDLAAPSASASALEREYPTFAGVLAREWGNAALAGRLCEMLARGGEDGKPLSAEATEELEVLRRAAEKLGRRSGFAAAAGD